jgi:hypothetical protein
LITRTILPIVSQPSFPPGQDRETGLGDTLFKAFLSPKDSGAWIWGAGPSAVLLTMRGPWVVGSLFSNVWSFTDDKDVNVFTW